MNKYVKFMLEPFLGHQTLTTLDIKTCLVNACTLQAPGSSGDMTHDMTASQPG